MPLLGGDQTSMRVAVPTRWSILLTFENDSQRINELGHCAIQIRTIAFKGANAIWDRPPWLVAMEGFCHPRRIFSVDAYRSPALQIHPMKRPAKAITCPECGSLMSLALAPGGKGPYSLRCEQCDRPDPLMTVEAAGWLRGDLRPPK